MRTKIAISCLALAVAVWWCWPRTLPPPVPTFTRNVAPIIHAKCAGCHHPSEAAPFSLLTYDDVRTHGSLIKDVTHRRFMPPWLPDEGDFENNRRLNEAELQTIQEWISVGMPFGEEAELPPLPVFAESWQAGPPDLVLESPAYSLAAEGRDVFRNFVVPVPLASPRWIQSIELRPSNPKVAHHARLGIDSTNESARRDAEDPEPGYAGMAWGQDPDGQLVIWAPGMIAKPGSSNVAWRLFPRSCVVLHTHLQPSGKPESLSFRIGIRFAPESPKVHPAILRLGSTNIDIPAGAAKHVISDAYTLPIDVDAHTIFPHAHSLCTEVRVEAERPDGSQETLIAIGRFDENWHDTYRFRAPVRLTRGTTIRTTFAYDNTEANVRNRSRPPKRTVYGSHITDEMADVYLQVTAVRPEQRAVLLEHYRDYDLKAQIAGHRKTLELAPDDPWEQEALAACLVGAGDIRGAIPVLEARLKTAPSVFAVASLGMALLATDAVRAEVELRKALALDSQYLLAWYGLGKSLASQQQNEKAEEAFRKAITLAPGLADAHLGLADLLMRRGALEEATAVCTAALADSPDMATLHLKLAEISAKRKRESECLEHCRAARALAPYTHPPKVLLAVFVSSNGDPERAVKLLQEARTESPDHPIAPLMLGQAALRRRDLVAAREYFAAAAMIPPPEVWPASHLKRFLELLQSERKMLNERQK